MSKITFRADDDLIERVEALEASKSEVMRDALRAYLDVDAPDDATERTTANTLDAMVAERVDALIEERLGSRDRDVNVNVTVEPPAWTDPTTREANAHRARDPPESDPEPTPDADRAATTCGQCGETVDRDHVYCPNCGEKQSRRVFCECGDELRTDWSFCPGCGRRTPAADVLDRS